MRYAAGMSRLACALVSISVLCACGGGGSKSKDWSGAELPLRALDYCIKLAGCTQGAGEGTIAECIEAMADLQAFLIDGQVPTRRSLSDLVTLRDCYNQARDCSAVRYCAGVPEDADLPECDLEASADVCEERMGLELLRTCLPDPDGEGGVRVEIDCTRFGRECNFDEDNSPRCVARSCDPEEFEPVCDEETGDITVCGEVDTFTGLRAGLLLNVYVCGSIGLSCALFDEGDPETYADDWLNCVSTTGEECDPFAVAPSCDGSVLSACLQNPDGTGSMASWDCARGSIHHTCSPDPPAPGCAATNIICDPAEYPGTCDGSSLTVCIDGDLVETDCREHGLDDCEPDATGKGRCVN